MTVFANNPMDMAAQVNGGQREVQTGQSSLRRAITAAGGAAFLMAAVGLWAIPSEDAAMQLMKLPVSGALFLGGLIMFRGLREKQDQPEVRIDASKRQLRVYEYDRDGRSVLSACHDIDSLEELSLTGQTLRARGADGQLIVSMPVPSRAAEMRLRKLLSQAG